MMVKNVTRGRCLLVSNQTTFVTSLNLTLHVRRKAWYDFTNIMPPGVCLPGCHWSSMRIMVFEISSACTPRVSGAFSNDPVVCGRHGCEHHMSTSVDCKVALWHSVFHLELRFLSVTEFHMVSSRFCGFLKLSVNMHVGMFAILNCYRCEWVCKCVRMLPDNGWFHH